MVLQELLGKEEFAYSKNIESIKPLVLNLTLSTDKEGKRTGELRKKFLIKAENTSFWSELFSASLSGKTIKAEVIIEFSNPFLSAIKLKEWGLLKTGTVIKEK